MLVSHQNTFAVELECVPEAFSAALTKGHKFYLKIDTRLKQDSHWSTVSDLSLNNLSQTVFLELTMFTSCSGFDDFSIS